MKPIAMLLSVFAVFAFSADADEERKPTERGTQAERGTEVREERRDDDKRKYAEKIEREWHESPRHEGEGGDRAARLEHEVHALHEVVETLHRELEGLRRELRERKKE